MDYTLTDEHRAALESLDDIKKVYGAYQFENGSWYITVLDCHGKQKNRGLKSSLIRCGIWLNEKVQCKECEEEFVQRQPNHLYCSDKCRKLVKARAAKVTSRSKVLSVYGLTVDDYDRMLDEQDGVCKICHKVPKRFVVDHCHKSGKVRGLLCVRCNSCLGWFESYNNEARLYIASSS